MVTLNCKGVGLQHEARGIRTVKAVAKDRKG